MANTITGRVHRITPEQTITGKSGKTFTKRTLVLDAARYDTHTGEKKYDNYPSIEFTGDSMKTLDKFKEDDAVVVSFDINGTVTKSSAPATPGVRAVRKHLQSRPEAP